MASRPDITELPDYEGAVRHLCAEATEETPEFHEQLASLYDVLADLHSRVADRLAERAENPVGELFHRGQARRYQVRATEDHELVELMREVETYPPVLVPETDLAECEEAVR